MYIPKNKIKTNLYTRGNEFQYVSNKEMYSGYYHKLYTGKFYTGKTPDDKPVYEIIRIPINDAQWESTPLTGEGTYTSFASNFDGEVVEGQTQDMREIDVYNSLKDVDINKVLKNPTPYYPKPTEDDYKLGVFKRYFCVKVNEEIYYEISKKDFEAINNKDRTYTWDLWTPFSLTWTISGDEQEVERTNYNMVQIREQRIKRRGLKQFLRGNYLKFYKA